MNQKYLPDAEELLAFLISEIGAVVDKDIALVGIHTGGVWLAERLHAALEISVPIGALDVSFYRDDYGVIGLHAQTKPSEIPFEVEGRRIILVDDVLYTGRTIRAAMNELFDYGRPASIQLAALIDRGGRELPIAAQFVGAEISLRREELLALEKDESGRLHLRVHPWRRQN